MVRRLTAITGAALAIDGAGQIALALTIATAMFIADSTAARIVVLGTGLVVTIQYLRNQRRRLNRGRDRPGHEHGAA